MPRVLKIPRMAKEEKRGVEKIVKSEEKEDSKKTVLEVMLTQKMQVKRKGKIKTKTKRKETAEARR